MTAWVSGAVCCVFQLGGGQVFNTLLCHFIVFLKVDPSLQVQFVPRISFLYSMCTVLLLFPFKSFWVKGLTKPPLLYLTFLFSYTTNLTLTTKTYCTNTLSSHMPAYPRCSEKYEKWRTAQMVKTKTSPLLLHHHHTFSNFFSVFFFFCCCSCRGYMPLISHQSGSPHWPCSVILINVIIILFYSSSAKYCLTSVVQRQLQAISHPLNFFSQI